MGGPLGAESSAGYRRLTFQQLETLRALSVVDTIETAAARLGVSPATTKSHAREIYRRFGAADRSSVLAEGRRRGLL